jgi:hypothetical protein
MIRPPIITCPKCGNKNEVALEQSNCFNCGANLPEESVDSYLARTLSEKTDQELIGILESPTDWEAKAVGFARSELGRRSISTAQIEQMIAEKTKRKAEELQQRSSVRLTFWESVFIALDGAALGLLGLFFVWPQASRFKSDGYILKSEKSWRLYWFAFGVRLAAVVILVIIAVATSH